MAFRQSQSTATPFHKAKSWCWLKPIKISSPSWSRQAQSPSFQYSQLHRTVLQHKSCRNWPQLATTTDPNLTPALILAAQRLTTRVHTSKLTTGLIQARNRTSATGKVVWDGLHVPTSWHDTDGPTLVKRSTHVQFATESLCAVIICRNMPRDIWQPKRLPSGSRKLRNWNRCNKSKPTNEVVSNCLWLTNVLCSNVIHNPHDLFVVHVIYFSTLSQPYGNDPKSWNLWHSYITFATWYLYSAFFPLHTGNIVLCSCNNFDSAQTCF